MPDLKTHTVRAALDRELRKRGFRLETRFWGYLLEENRVADVLDGEPIEELADAHERLRQHFSQQREPATPPITAGRSRRFRVLHEIQAAEAAELPEIQGFRRRWMRKDLIRHREVGKWVRARIGRGGRRTRQPLPSGPLYFYDDKAIDHVVVPGSRGGSLRALISATATLESLFGWDQSDAVDVVLCGRSRRSHPGLYGVRVTHGPPSSRRVVLTLNPGLSPKEVAWIYSHERKASGLVRQAVGDRGLRLAEFIARARRENGLSWAEAQAAWVHESGEPIRDRANFAKDCRRAYENLTGGTID